MTAYELDRHEVELSIVVAGSCGTEQAILLQELRKDDFRNDVARDAFLAIRAILDGHEHVDQLLVHRRLVDAGRKSSAKVLAESWHLGDTLAGNFLKHRIAYLVDISTRDRVRTASQSTLALLADPENSLEILHERCPMLLAEALARSVPHEAVSARDTLLELAAEASEREDRDELAELLLETGIGPIDELQVGGAPGEVIVLAAPPSAGKSALALQFAQAWAGPGWCYYWTGEMPRKQLARRLTIQRRAIPKEKLTSSSYSQTAGEPIDRLYIDDERLGIDRLLQKVTMFKMLHPELKSLVVDYLGLLCDNDYKAVSRASRLLKQLAGKLGITVLLLCQLKRGLGQRSDPTPQMDDLRDSGQIEQDADKVLMLHRPGYYDPSKDQTEALLFVRKFRDGERNVAIRLRWEGKLFSFFAPPPTRPGFRIPRPEPELREDYDPEYFPGFRDQAEMSDIPL